MHGAGYPTGVGSARPFLGRAGRLLAVTMLTVVPVGIGARSGEIWMPDTAACNRLATTIDIVACIDQRTVVWDARLNQAWKILVGMMGGPEMKEQFGLLQASQRMWIQYRDANCRFYDAEQGTIRQIDGAECRRRMTQDRAIELLSAGPQA